MRVYLAGGMKTDWRTDVISGTISAHWLDPMDHDMTDPSGYVAWDLAAIEEADVVFAYIEASNHTPIGLAAELGYARALGKVIILVVSRSFLNMRSLNFVRQLADYNTHSLEEGVKILEKFSFIYGD